MKLLLGIIIGAVLSGILSAIAGTYISLTSGASGVLGIKSRDLWWFGLILGGVVGTITGSFVGGVITALKLDSIRGGGMVVLIFILPTLFFYFFSTGKFGNDSIKFGISLVFISVITGIVVPAITSHIEKFN